VALAIYLSKLPRVERKIRVALDWWLDLLFDKDLVQIEPPTGARFEAPGHTMTSPPATEAHRRPPRALALD